MQVNDELERIVHSNKGSYIACYNIWPMKLTPYPEIHRIQHALSQLAAVHSPQEYREGAAADDTNALLLRIPAHKLH